HTDDGMTTIALPFTYTFYGQAFTSANASSNGTLQFTSHSAPPSNGCLPTGSTFTDVIMGHWDDLFTGDTAGGQGIFTSTSGVAPNRIFNIEWRAQYCCTSGAPVVNFEVRVDEGQNRFDIVYGTVQNGGSSATVGVQRDTGSLFTQFSCNTTSL